MKTNSLTNDSRRDNAIDILKFLAVLLITWSHFDLPLGKYAMFSTGGAFGDSLFFFISGYTLLLSNRKSNFFNWYKRRINRIYPTVFAWALFVAIFWGGGYDMLGIIKSGGGFFVTCIMLFYIIFYPINEIYQRNISTKYWNIVLITSFFVLYAVCYFLFVQTNQYSLYKWSWCGYFISMLVGALVGKTKKDMAKSFLNGINIWVLIICLFASASTYYLLMYYEQETEWLVILNIIPLVCVACFLFELTNRLSKISFIRKQYIYWIIRFVGSLCLEVYIVQPRIITDRINNLLPYNLLLIFIAIILVAYCLKTLGRFWAQTFKDEDYDWKGIVKCW